MDPFLQLFIRYKDLSIGQSYEKRLVKKKEKPSVDGFAGTELTA